MTIDPPPGLFVVGTDTGVGKTFVASAILRCLRASGARAGAIKPVASGARRVGDRLVAEDAEALADAIGGVVALDRINPLAFEAPLAPPIAARQEGAELGSAEVLAATFDALRWWAKSAEAERVVVEGVGGLLCPLAEGMTVADLCGAIDYPLVIVARRGLGTLNHTLLTVEVAEARGLRVAGIVLNDATPSGGDGLTERTNAEALARLVAAPILAEVAYSKAGAILCRSFDLVDWSGRAARPRRAWPRAESPQPVPATV